MTISATYSPDDNKLRLYATARLGADEYERVKKAGFKWAPKQGLFFAPMWTPQREDLCLELAGEIDDEDSTLIERAEDRADRFDSYSERRAQEAQQQHNAVDRLVEHIPLGQPILVGHHSERAARRDAERIQNGMRKAVRLWDTSTYWTERAQRAIQHAKYKELPAVRARRIKKLEAELRSKLRDKEESELRLRLWGRESLSHELAMEIANRCSTSHTFTLAEYPRDEPVTQYEGPMSLWSALRDNVCTVQQARVLATRSAERVLAWAMRWITHYEMRLTYERAMLEEQGGIATDRTKPEKGGAIRAWCGPNFGAAGGWCYVTRVNKVSVSVKRQYQAGGRVFSQTVPFDDVKGVMTAAEVEQARSEGRITEVDGGTGFFLAAPPTPAEENAPATGEAAAEAPAVEVAPEDAAAKVAASMAFESMRQQLQAGVRVEVAPTLYPTSAPVAARMVELAALTEGMTYLEPEAGTGAILDAARTQVPGAIPTAVEISHHLADALRQRFENVRTADFLRCTAELGTFDRVLMNPPFDKAQDIAHIKHALTFVKPGGRLVAICANGPRQQAALRPLVEATGGLWEDLPPGAFAHAGTNVRAALLVIHC